MLALLTRKPPPLTPREQRLLVRLLLESGKHDQADVSDLLEWAAKRAHRVVSGAGWAGFAPRLPLASRFTGLPHDS